MEHYVVEPVNSRCFAHRLEEESAYSLFLWNKENLRLTNSSASLRLREPESSPGSGRLHTVKCEESEIGGRVDPEWEPIADAIRDDERAICAFGVKAAPIAEHDRASAKMGGEHELPAVGVPGKGEVIVLDRRVIE